MGAIGGPNIIEDGLVLSLDAASPRSYPGSGTTLYDLSPYNTNPIIYQSTFNNNYFELDGTDDNIYISTLSTNAPQISSITNVVSAEVSFYPYSTSSDTTGTLIRCGLGTDITFGFFYSRVNKNIFLQWWSTTFNAGYSSNNVVTLDGWNIASFSRNGSSLSFYMNGTHINTVTGLSDPTPTPNSLGIGAARAGTAVGSNGQDMQGRLSTIKIYNKALTSDEVLQNYNSIKNRFNL